MCGICLGTHAHSRDVHALGSYRSGTFSGRLLFIIDKVCVGNSGVSWSLLCVRQLVWDNLPHQGWQKQAQTRPL